MYCHPSACPVWCHRLAQDPDSLSPMVTTPAPGPAASVTNSNEFGGRLQDGHRNELGITPSTAVGITEFSGENYV